MHTRRVTQLDLAVMAGVSPSTVFRLLHDSNPHVSTIALAAQAMGYQLELRFSPQETQ